MVDQGEGFSKDLDLETFVIKWKHHFKLVSCEAMV